MSKKRSKRKNVAALPPASSRTMVSLIVPVLVSLLLSGVLTSWFSGRGESAVFFLGGLGLASLFMGLTWYGTAEMGFRGGRPMFSSAGFAFLGWLAVLIVRIWYIESQEETGVGIASDFFYLLLFESFAVQVWAFGTFFRSVADWRGPLTAAVASGLAFGSLGSLYFIEAGYDLNVTVTAYFYFIVWGILYGIIRLRTGSIVGLVVAHAMQSLTTWHILLPLVPTSDPTTWGYFYTITATLYIILIWRLWPKEESDYRV